LEDVMRLTIFGASGQTGRHLLTQALDTGHTVTAVVRDPTRLPIRHDGLTVLAADVLDPAAIQPAVAGADAVISALGPHPPRNRSSIMSAATASILAAMRATGTSGRGLHPRRAQRQGRRLRAAAAADPGAVLYQLHMRVGSAAKPSG
jgi:nucleoside-diphosphate-sugar epimerase